MELYDITMGGALLIALLFGVATIATYIWEHKED